MRKISIDEDEGSASSSSKRLSRFLPNCKPKKYIWNFIYIIYYYYIFVLFTIFSSCLSQWFCIRNTVMLLSTERFRGSRGQSQELMKKEGTLCPLATSPHPAHSAHHEAPPFPFGRIFLMFGPVDNSTTSAMKSVNCRRWLHIQKVCFVLFFINQQILLKKKQLILSCFLISGQVWVGDIRGLIHTQLVYCSWPFYDVSWAVWVSWDAGEAVALLQTAWCERSQWEVNKDEE